MEPAHPPAVRLDTLRVYYLASFAALGTQAPYFPRWLEAHGVEGLSMGLVAGLVPAMGVLGPPSVGLLADALGVRGSLLRVACFGAYLSMGALALGAALGRLSFGAIFALVLLFGAFRSPMVVLADVIALERARAAGTDYGKLRLWGSVGFLAAVLVVGWAVDPRAGAALPATVAGLLLVAFFAASRLPGSPAVRRPPGRARRPCPGLRAGLRDLPRRRGARPDRARRLRPLLLAAPARSRRDGRRHGRPVGGGRRLRGRAHGLRRARRGPLRGAVAPGGRARRRGRALGAARRRSGPCRCSSRCNRCTRSRSGCGGWRPSRTSRGAPRRTRWPRRRGSSPPRSPRARSRACSPGARSIAARAAAPSSPRRPRSRSSPRSSPRRSSAGRRLLVLPVLPVLPPPRPGP